MSKYDSWVEQYLAKVERLRDVAVSEGNAGEAALAGALVQSVIHHRRQREMRQREWPRQSQVADLLGVERPRICQLIDQSRLKTNGAKFKESRVEPISLLREYIDATAKRAQETNLRYSVINEIGSLLGDR